MIFLLNLQYVILLALLGFAFADQIDDENYKNYIRDYQNYFARYQEYQQEQIAYLSGKSSVEPVPPRQPGAFVLREFQQKPVSSFSWSYDTPDGIHQDQTNEFVDGANHYTGTYTYPGADGKPVSVSYTAGEEGYQPKFH